MKLTISYEKFTFEAPSVWLDDEYVPVVGTQRLFSHAEKHEPQSGPYVWLKIAMIDAVIVNANEGSIQWFPSIFRTALCPLHPFNGSGQVRDEDDSDSMSATSNSSNWHYIHIDSDFDELIDRAAGIACRFKDKSLEGKDLNDAIFGWLYAFLLPASPVNISDQPVLEKTLQGMKVLLRNQNGSLLFADQATQPAPSQAESNSDSAGSNKLVNLYDMVIWSEFACQSWMEPDNKCWSAECDLQHERFSFGIPLACRSYKEITMVASQTPKFQTQRQVMCQRMTDALQQDTIIRVPHFFSEDSVLAATDCQSWWQAEIDKLLPLVREHISFAKQPNGVSLSCNYDANKVFQSKVALVCSDIVFQAAYDHVVSYYYATLELVMEKLKHICCRTNSSDRPEDVIRLLVTKYEQSATVGLLIPDRAELFSNHLLTAVRHMNAFIEEKSLINKARLLLLVEPEITSALAIYRANAGADILLEFVIDIIPLFDYSFALHVKILEDFGQLIQWECSGKLAYILTVVLMACNQTLLESDDIELRPTSPFTDPLEILNGSTVPELQQLSTIDNHDLASSFSILQTTESSSASSNNSVQEGRYVENDASNNLPDPNHEILIRNGQVAFRSFRLVHEQWSSTRLACIENLRQLAEAVRKTVSNTNIASITGSAVGIVSGATAIAGIVLIPFTAGLSTALIVGSAVAGGAGGLTGLGSFIARRVINSQQEKELKSLCDRDHHDRQELSEALITVLEFDRQIMIDQPSAEFLQRRLTNRDNETRDAVKFDNVVVASGATRAVRTALTPIKALPLVRLASNIAAETAGAVRVVRVASVAFAGAFVALDIFSMVVAAVEVHKGNKTELYHSIIGIIEYLEMEQLYYATLIDRAEAVDNNI